MKNRIFKVKKLKTIWTRTYSNKSMIIWTMNYRNKRKIWVKMIKQKTRIMITKMFKPPKKWMKFKKLPNNKAFFLNKKILIQRKKMLLNLTNNIKKWLKKHTQNLINKNIKIVFLYIKFLIFLHLKQKNYLNFL